MFERLRQSIRAYRDERGTRTNTLFESGWITALSAGAAGSVAAVVTTPVDVVKTRIMLAAAESAAEDQRPARSALKDATGNSVQAAKASIGEAIKNISKPVSRKGSLQIGREIVQEHGVKGLFRGGALRALWTFLGAGLYLGTYEAGRIYLAGRRNDKIDVDGV